MVASKLSLWIFLHHFLHEVLEIYPDFAYPLLVDHGSLFLLSRFAMCLSRCLPHRHVVMKKCTELIYLCFCSWCQPLNSSTSLVFLCIQVDWEGWAIYNIQIAFMHEEIFKKSVYSLSDITGCPIKTAVMFLMKTDALIVHSVTYFLKAKFFILGIWVGHRIRHAELYLLAENWLLLLTNLLFNDSVSMLFFIVMNTGLLIRWSDKCAVCLENYAGLKVVLWIIKKGKNL